MSFESNETKFIHHIIMSQLSSKGTIKTSELTYTFTQSQFNIDTIVLIDDTMEIFSKLITEESMIKVNPDGPTIPLSLTSLFTLLCNYPNIDADKAILTIPEKNDPSSNTLTIYVTVFSSLEKTVFDERMITLTKEPVSKTEKALRLHKKNKNDITELQSEVNQLKNTVISLDAKLSTLIEQHKIFCASVYTKDEIAARLAETNKQI